MITTIKKITNNAEGYRDTVYVRGNINNPTYKKELHYSLVNSSGLAMNLNKHFIEGDGTPISNVVTTVSSGVQTLLSAQGEGSYLHLTSIILSNQALSNKEVYIKDGNTTKLILNASSQSTSPVELNPKISFSANTPITFTVSSSGASASETISLTVNGYYNGRSN